MCYPVHRLPSGTSTEPKLASCERTPATQCGPAVVVASIHTIPPDWAHGQRALRNPQTSGRIYHLSVCEAVQPGGAQLTRHDLFDHTLPCPLRIYRIGWNRLPPP